MASATGPTHREHEEVTQKAKFKINMSVTEGNLTNVSDFTQTRGNE
jgi:hypothetical protein